VPNKISAYTPSEPPLTSLKGPGGNAAAAKTASEPASAAAGTPAKADQVTFTGSARTLQKLGETLAQTPVVNAAKVASVKQAVQSGSYQVDAGRVADKLLEFDSKLN